jgi:hypothetical protein
MSSDNVQKNRKLGTRAMVRIARRLAWFPQDDDLNAIIGRSLLSDFLPAVERMNLDTLLLGSGIKRRAPAVRNTGCLLNSCSTSSHPSLIHHLLYAMTASCSQKQVISLRSPSRLRFRVSTLLKIVTEWHLMFLTWTISTIIACKRGSCVTLLLTLSSWESMSFS